MPLVKRAVSPVNVSLHRLPPSIKRDELLCVANGTLSNLVRQLSSLSRHAEQIFGEIYHDVVKLDHKTNTLKQRIERLTHKVTQLDCNQEQFSLGDLHLRKPFKSSCIIDQHTLDRQTLPSPLIEKYRACDSPPHLDALNPYRDDPKSALSFYTDPSYFFDLWKKEMLKETGDIRRNRAAKSPTTSKSPTKKKRNRHSAEPAPLPPRTSYMIASTQRPNEMLNFPSEYQAPQIARADKIEVPTGMSVPSMNHYLAQLPPAVAEKPIRVAPPIPQVAQKLQGNLEMMEKMANRLNAVDLQDYSVLDDEELPPPPPPLMHTSLVCSMPAPPSMQFVPPSETSTVPPPPPPPPPPQSGVRPLTATSEAAGPVGVVVGSFANKEEVPPSEKSGQPENQRSNLLAEIQSGIKLKQVQRKEQAAEERAAADSNDVAAILRRRMEKVLCSSDTESVSDDEEWE
ncbi:hypothetical protein AB6A40_005895 [Gnathostoma spinigerum]|uniref:Wiskott-Aldrich syndrome protein family member n=1 Tax=Gnathostoma spinigerum TaxID=75299 RepID=A0ABD6EIV2_9BILA